jgi:probable O-glycosylation ligase (exosortase A-associated)
VVALGRTTPIYSKYEKHLFRFMAIGCVYRAISTYSRGGFLALGAVGMHYLVFSKRKLAAIAGVAIVALLIYPVLPQAFWDRMNTIPRGTEAVENSEDNSTRTRLHFWGVAIAMANANPFTGIGHNAYNVRYIDYDPLHGQWGRIRSVHSSWFGVLAEYGYPGLFLFLGIIANAFITCRGAQRQAKRHPELKDLGALANGIERALVAFVIGGSFVIFQYTEMLWHTLALSIVVGRLVRERAAALAVAPQPTMAATAALPHFKPVRPVAARKAQA